MSQPLVIIFLIFLLSPLAVYAVDTCQAVFGAHAQVSYNGRLSTVIEAMESKGVRTSTDVDALNKLSFNSMYLEGERTIVSDPRLGKLDRFFLFLHESSHAASAARFLQGTYSKQNATLTRFSRESMPIDPELHPSYSKLFLLDEVRAWRKSTALLRQMEERASSEDLSTLNTSSSVERQKYLAFAKVSLRILDQAHTAIRRAIDGQDTVILSLHRYKDDAPGLFLARIEVPQKVGTPISVWLPITDMAAKETNYVEGVLLKALKVCEDAQELARKNLN